MPRYSGFGLVIESEIELPELDLASSEPDVVIRIGAVPAVWGRAAVDEEIRFNRWAARFHLLRGREIIVDPVPNYDPVILRLNLLGRIMAYTLRQRGWLPLHASGVAVGKSAVLFLGESGDGKSTAAAAFYADKYPIVTDDIGAVRSQDGKCIVGLGPARLRLMEQSRGVLDNLSHRAELQTDKYSCELIRAPLEATLPVRNIYVLEYGPKLRSIPVDGLPAVTLLSRHCFATRRRMTADALRIHLRDCAAVAGTTSVRRLMRPRTLGALPDFVRFVTEDVVR